MQTDKFIKIHDDLFTYDQRYHMLSFLKRSFFTITGEDSDLNLYPAQQIFSTFRAEDVIASGFQTTAGYEKLDIEYKLSERKIKQVRLNLSQYGEKNSVHTDSAGLTLLYYPMLEWKVEWGGHTIFLNNNIDDIIYISMYKPGRIVIFDGTIPHLIIPPTVLSPFYRLCFAIQFT